MSELKTIVLCADDFGLNQGVSQGILKLVRLQRLSAVSCMVNVPGFALHASDLIALKNHIQIGLHFNLTEGSFISNPQAPCFSLKELLIKTHLGLTKTLLIKKELNAQLDKFFEIMGYVPDFIDGHQHVHQFPGIRQLILELYDIRLRHNKTFIRSTYPAKSLPQFQTKSKILALTGGKQLHAQLKGLDIAHNNYFSGIYDFSPQTDYRALFRKWLALAPSNTLIMCHPGEKNDSEDSIAATRFIELNYFLSDDFVRDCEEYNVHLATGP